MMENVPCRGAIPLASMVDSGSWMDASNGRRSTGETGSSALDGRQAVKGRMSTPLTPGFVAVHPEALQYSRRRRGGLIRSLLRLTLTAALYALLLHVALVMGLVAYAITQEGFPGILPVLSHAGDAYVGAWMSAITVA